MTDRPSPDQREAIARIIDPAAWRGSLTKADVILSRIQSQVPDDVARLVVAARIVAHESQDADALRELDEASEAFADRVWWEGEPDTTDEGDRS